MESLAGRLSKWQRSRSYMSCCPDGACVRCSDDLANLLILYVDEVAETLRHKNPTSSWESAFNDGLRSLTRAVVLPPKGADQ